MSWLDTAGGMGPSSLNGTVTDHPDLYDALFGGYKSDIRMYLDSTQEEQQVLECGIGTGRLAIPLALANRHVTGFDNSPAMLARLKKRVAAGQGLEERLRVLQADMTSFNVGQSFPVVICGFMTFNYLMTQADQLKFLERVKVHLQPKGTFWLELMSFATLPELSRNDGKLRQVARRFDDQGNRVLDVFRTVRFDSATQVVEQDRIFKLYDADGMVTSERLVTWRNRLVLLGELELLLQRAGLRLVATHGNHELDPFAHSSEFLVASVTRDQ